MHHSNVYGYVQCLHFDIATATPTETETETVSIK